MAARKQPRLPPIPNPPPGPQRSAPPSTTQGKIPFDPANFDITGETAYWLWGELDATSVPLIVLHGGPGATHKGNEALSLLHTDFGIPVIMYDQMGCGGSTRFRERKGDEALWTPELFIDELANLIAYFQAQHGIKQVDLIGHSWGARLGALFAYTQHPAIRKLVVGNVGTGMKDGHAVREKTREALPEDIKAVFRRAKEGEKVPPEELEAAVFYEFGNFLCRVRPWPDHVLNMFDTVREDDTVYSTMYGFNAGGSLPRKPNDFMEKDLHKITAKTVPGGMLVVSGRYDNYTSETMQKWFTVPTCKVMWVRFGLSSHSIMQEEPEEYLETLGFFLKMENPSIVGS